MTKRTSKLIARKRKVYSKYKDSKHPAYIQASIKADKAVKEAKRKFEELLAQNIKEDSKSFYAYVRSKSKSKVKPGPLVDADGQVIASDDATAEEFNKYFASVFTNEDVTNMPDGDEIGNLFNKLDSVSIDESDVRAKLKRLREDKSAGPDELSPRFLHIVGEYLSYPLMVMFNKTLKDGKVPDDWKSSNIAPIFKNGKRGLPKNYRPVSLTSQVSNIFESIIGDRIVYHLESQCLLRDSQHGFRKGKSCLTNLLTFLDRVTGSVDEGDAVDVVFLDLAKAFDKVPHQRLIKKLKIHGIEGDLLNWIVSWLTGRKQRVCFNGHLSRWRRVTSGVPQGSVLGPILFLIYINDLDGGIVNWILKFADDTKVFAKIRSADDASSLQRDLDRLVQWAREWQMMFNVKKCKVMHMGRKNPRYQYRMNGQVLETVKQEKDLGVVISDDLKVSNQCSMAYLKANRTLGLIKRTIEYKSEFIMLRLYKSLVRPHLE